MTSSERSLFPLRCSKTYLINTIGENRLNGYRFNHVYEYSLRCSCNCERNNRWTSSLKTYRMKLI